MITTAFRAAALAALLSIPLAPAARAAEAGDPETKSEAVTPEILDALASEIERAMVSMEIPNAPKPYFIGYKVTEVEVHDAAASLGAITADKRRHFVNIESHVHVGDHEFDNTNFVMPQREQIDGSANTQLPLEPDPKIARRSAWLVTDAAYKEALEQITSKVDAIRTGAAAGRSDVPSYTAAEARVQTEPVLVPKLETLDHLRDRARAVSRVFRDDPHIRDSRVAFTSFLERRWYLNSDGTSAHDTRRVSGVIIVATAQAEDGQHLALYDSHYGFTEADLPSQEQLEREARELSGKLEALQTAPVVDNYTGPVLFEGAGAAGIVREELARDLGGTPMPIGLSRQVRTRIGGGALADRVGLPVLSPMLDVVDDPTASRAQDRALIGGFQFDDEGVPAERVGVIDDGKLETLLMGRVPSEAVKSSNGHARLVLPGGVYHGSATNLLVSGKRGVRRERLRKRLVRAAKRQGMPYGLVIRQLDDPAITANAELSRIELFQLLKARDPEAPPRALLAYRVYPDGREELVRGVQLKPVSMRAWRDVAAVGRRRTVFNYLASTDDSNLVRLTGGGAGFVPSAGVESAVVTPDLLFEQLDVVKSTTGKRPEPAVAKPDAGGEPAKETAETPEAPE